MDDISADEESVDDIFDDYEGKHLEKCVSKK